MRAAIREETAGRTLVMALATPELTAEFDHLIQVKPDGGLREGPPSKETETA